MNILFKVLWFEDSPDWLELEKHFLDYILENHNLKSDVTHFSDDAFNFEEILSNNYDLILMDFKLARNISGIDIASKIRDNKVITDILFYSSDYDGMISEIKTSIPQIDGVYLAKRQNNVFNDKLERLVNKIIKRSEDIVFLRGFVLDYTSDFEMRIQKILNVFWENATSEEKKEIVKRIEGISKSKQDHLERHIIKMAETGDVLKYANSTKNFFLSTSDRLDILNDIFKILMSKSKLQRIEGFKSFKDFYLNKINVYRNKLGHVDFSKDKAIKVSGKNILIDSNLHKQLRKNIREVDAKIQEIEKIVLR